MGNQALSDYEHDAVHSVDRLRTVYGEPSQLVVDKVTDRVDELTARYVQAASLVLVGSYGLDGCLDVTPRGGPPGFVKILGERLLAMPDAVGNRRLDTLQNVVQTGRVGALFLIPGRNDAVRVNGRAVVTTRPELLDQFETTEGKPPRAALLIEPEELFVHCPRALRLSNAWKPQEWLDLDAAPTLRELIQVHAATT